MNNASLPRDARKQERKVIFSIIWTWNIKEKKTEIQYIQDAIEDFGEFEEFNGMITNIVKYKENDVKISCLYGNDYIFNLPQNDDYIDFYESLF